MMFRVDVLGNLPRVRQLAELLFTVTHRKGLNLAASYFRSQRSHRARIKASAKKYSEWNIAHQMRCDCLLQQFTISLHIVVVWLRLGVYLRGQIPIPLNLWLATFGNFQRVPGDHLLYARQHGFRASDISECKIFGEHLAIELRHNLRICQYRFYFRSK